MAYRIKIKDVDGIIHYIETSENTFMKTTNQLLQMAANAMGVVTGGLKILDHGKKEDVR
jgi:hypothetical protein